MTDPSLAGYLEAERKSVDDALAAILARLGGGVLAEAIRYAVGAGGKRLRPILCVAGYRAVAGEPGPDVFRLAAALELIHTYSLVHDDLPSMDDDPVRRGWPSTHIVHGVPAATLAGAAIIPLAARTALEAAGALGLEETAQARIVLDLCRAAGAAGMVGGQLLDLDAEGRPVELEGLERIHRMKTGALLAVAPRLGGLAGRADDRVMTALDVYGRSLGLAFQITDDILDVTSSTAVLGKTAGRDTELEKATYPAVAGVDAAARRAREEAEVARAALEAVGLRSEELAALVVYAIERDR